MGSDSQFTPFKIGIPTRQGRVVESDSSTLLPTQERHRRRVACCQYRWKTWLKRNVKKREINSQVGLREHPDMSSGIIPDACCCLCI